MYAGQTTAEKLFALPAAIDATEMPPSSINDSDDNMQWPGRHPHVSDKYNRRSDEQIVMSRSSDMPRPVLRRPPRAPARAPTATPCSDAGVRARA